MRTLCKLGLVITVLALSGAAFAAEEKAGPGDKVVYKKKTIIDFSNVNIEGELRKPEGGFYGSRKKTRFGKLIQTRPNFVPEILSSTDNL